MKYIDTLITAHILLGWSPDYSGRIIRTLLITAFLKCWHGTNTKKMVKLMHRTPVRLAPCLAYYKKERPTMPGVLLIVYSVKITSGRLLLRIRHP